MRYDPEEDTPFGLASADFPITLYEKPSYAFANLLRGDVDGLTRAMFAPDTLTPSQMKTIPQLFMKGKKPGPIMKTILDIATNPIVIAGLLVSLKYPMAGSNVLLNIRKGMLPKAAAMGKWMSGLHGAMMKFRSVPGMFEALNGTFLGMEKFTVKYGEKFRSAFVNAGPLSNVDDLVIAARLDGLHKPTHYMVKALQKEPEWMAFFGKKDVPIAAGMQARMSPNLIKTSDKLRTVFNDVWGKLTGDSEAWQRITKSLELKGYNVGGAVDDFFPRSADWNKYYKSAIRGSNGTVYRNYLRREVLKKVGPHEIAREGGLFANLEHLFELEKQGIIPTGFNGRVIQPVLNRWTDDAASVASKIWDDVTTLGLDAGKEQIEFATRMTEHYTKGAGKHLNFIGRLGNPKKARETLGAMAQALQDARFETAEVVQNELREIGKVLAVPGQYSLNPREGIQKYLQSVASDYAYHGLGNAKRIHNIVNTPGIFKGEPHLEPYLMDNLLPQMLGYKSWPQAQRSLNDLVRKDKVLNWLKNHPMVERTIGAEKKAALINRLEKSASLSSDAIGGQVANWFHITTLGMNLSATSANAMQTFLTTINNVGPQGVWRGLNGAAGAEGLLKKASRYMANVAKGVESSKAFNTAFPEFVAEQGEWAKTTRRLLEGDIAASGFPKLFKTKGVWEKVKGYMMMPFSGTEAGNQLLAFYSGRNQHIFENATKLASAGEKAGVLANANKAGSSLALLTQFAGGPLGIPSHIMNLNPMWRQYMHFPMRFLSYLHGSLRMGADPSKLDWGTIGRVLAGSTGLYIAGRNLLGMDLSRGLFVGALPIPAYEKAPFYPFPLVPPAATVLGGTAKALLTGDTKQLGSYASMMVPGGIAARRAFKTFSPRYADYKNPTPDGRIPLYNDDQALIGTLSPMELSLRAIGLRPQSVSAEAGAAKWLLSQRDRIRNYRREYTMALFQNETGRAERINREFQKVYPELGPLQIKKTDLSALENRREMSRIQRIGRAIPQAYRPIFEQILADATLSQVTAPVEMENLGGLQKYLAPQ